MYLGVKRHHAQVFVVIGPCILLFRGGLSSVRRAGGSALLHLHELLVLADGAEVQSLILYEVFEVEIELRAALFLCLLSFLFLHLGQLALHDYLLEHLLPRLWPRRGPIYATFILITHRRNKPTSEVKAFHHLFIEIPIRTVIVREVVLILHISSAKNLTLVGQQFFLPYGPTTSFAFTII